METEAQNLLNLIKDNTSKYFSASSKPKSLISTLNSSCVIKPALVRLLLPVIKRFWESKENTESFTIWILMLLVTAISLLSSKGMLATIYSLRAIVSITLLLSLMVRIELKKKRTSIQLKLKHLSNKMVEITRLISMEMESLKLLQVI